MDEFGPVIGLIAYAAYYIYKAMKKGQENTASPPPASTPRPQPTSPQGKDEKSLEDVFAEIMKDYDTGGSATIDPAPVSHEAHEGYHPGYETVEDFDSYDEPIDSANQYNQYQNYDFESAADKEGGSGTEESAFLSPSKAKKSTRRKTKSGFNPRDAYKSKIIFERKHFDV